MAHPAGKWRVGLQPVVAHCSACADMAGQEFRHLHSARRCSSTATQHASCRLPSLCGINNSPATCQANMFRRYSGKSNCIPLMHEDLTGLRKFFYHINKITRFSP
jgi:hypothetical protein